MEKFEYNLLKLCIILFSSRLHNPNTDFSLTRWSFLTHRLSVSVWSRAAADGRQWKPPEILVWKGVGCCCFPSSDHILFPRRSRPALPSDRRLNLRDTPEDPLSPPGGGGGGMWGRIKPVSTKYWEFIKTDEWLTFLFLPGRHLFLLSPARHTEPSWLASG